VEAALGATIGRELDTKERLRETLAPMAAPALRRVR
jgi:hypothetical protein